MTTCLARGSIMTYLTYCTLGFLLVHGPTAFSSPTSYDQRQTGDVNVQVHLKDVQVIALLDSDLLDDYTDYDYAYDYADFTLKPITKPTTSAPILSNGTSTTWPTKAPNSTTTIAEGTKLNATEESTTSTIVQEEMTTKSGQDISESDEKDENKLTETTSQSSLKKSCSPPSFLDKKGRCRSLKHRRRFSFVPFAVKIGSRLNERAQIPTTKDLPVQL